LSQEPWLNFGLINELLMFWIQPRPISGGWSTHYDLSRLRTIPYFIWESGSYSVHRVTLLRLDKTKVMFVVVQIGYPKQLAFVVDALIVKKKVVIKPPRWVTFQGHTRHGWKNDNQGIGGIAINLGCSKALLKRYGSQESIVRARLIFVFYIFYFKFNGFTEYNCWNDSTFFRRRNLRQISWRILRATGRWTKRKMVMEAIFPRSNLSLTWLLWIVEMPIMDGIVAVRK